MTGKNKERGRGSVVQSFSVPLRKVNLIDEVVEQAEKDGLTFSSLVVKLLENYNQEKNREAGINLSAIQLMSGNTITTTVVNESLDRFIEHISTIEDVKEAAALEGKTMQMHSHARQRYLFLKRR